MEIRESRETLWEKPQTDVTATGQLQILLFGGFELLQNGIPLPSTRTRTEQWLLALLVLRANKTVERAWLAGTLWPHTSPEQGFNNLRRSLSNLRQVLGSEAYRLLSPNTLTITFDLAGAFCDAVAFDAACARQDVASLREAVTLYRGSLLPECEADWLVSERESREQAYLKALETLAAQARQEGRAQEAVACLRQAVSLDPYRETLQCALLEALAAQGDRAGMTLAYRQFRLLLHDQLQSEPSEQTRALYLRLREEKGPRRSEEPSQRSESYNAPSPERAVLLHIPRPVSGLVGRQEECAEVARLLAGTRLLTLTGTGGVGKTRLALDVAARMTPRFRDGIWFVDLAGVTEEGLVANVVASTLELREEPGQSRIDALRRFVAEKELLLILDNCEHLIDACATLVTTLLQSAPELRILATSRQTLGVSGEQAWRVPSLSLPDQLATTAEGSPDLLLAWTATRLFVERAQEASASFQLTPHNARFILDICRRLDGIPLAIELAAARVKVLSVEQIAARLEDAFRLLTGGARTALPRQQTLRGLLDWSYALLTPPEQRLLNALSVFAGGWTLEAAEKVRLAEESRETDSPLSALHSFSTDIPDADDVLDALEALVDKSLVIMQESENGEVRYRLLETVRQYAQGKLRERGAWADIQRSHYAYFYGFAEHARTFLTGPQQKIWLQRLEQEHDNVRAAFDFCLHLPAASQEESDAPGVRALRLGIALGRFWEMHGHYSEGRSRMQTVLERADTQANSQERCDALNTLGVLCAMQGDFGPARRYHEEALTLQKARQDRSGMAHSTNRLAVIAVRQGDYATATAQFEEALAFCEATGDRQKAASIQNNLGLIAMEQHDWERARTYYEASLAFSREVGDEHLIAITLSNLGIVLQNSEDDKEAAMNCYQQALEIQQTLGDQSGVARTLSNLGWVISEAGNIERGNQYLIDSLSRYAALRDSHGVAYVLIVLANNANTQGQHERCVSLIGAEESLRRSSGFARLPGLQLGVDQILTQVREANGDALVDAWHAAGQRLTLEGAVHLARQPATS